MPRVFAYPYEFGVKVTLATTRKEGLLVGMRSMPGNPYDGHTLDETIDQVSILANKRARTVMVDKGLQGRGGRRRADPQIRPAARRDTHDEGDDRTA